MLKSKSKLFLLVPNDDRRRFVTVQAPREDGDARESYQGQNIGQATFL
jgi:hypothetical protein